MEKSTRPQPADLAPRLLPWFHRAKRDLPWRRTTDPYRIWVSEVMLQQTQVATVIPYYERFVTAFPEVASLAAASVDEVLSLWEGLGYYSRARNLHQAARVVVAEHDGCFPADYKSARALPGIGAYTAGAILSIAYGVRLPALDGNAYRVLARVFGVRGTVAGPVRRKLDGLGLAAVPADRPGDYNQAVMEHGSQVCAPTAPTCGDCCLADICVAKAQGLQATIPEVGRVATQQVSMAAALLLRRGRVLLAKRPASGIWAGLWEFPNVETSSGDEAAELRAYLRASLGLEAETATQFARLTHGVMNRRIELTAFIVEGIRGRTRPRHHDAVAWVLPAQLAAYALPAPHRRLATRLREHLGESRLPG